MEFKLSIFIILPETPIFKTLKVRKRYVTEWFPMLQYTNLLPVSNRQHSRNR